jgi:DNA-binding CsgD family transcriptional regulator
MKNTVSRFLPNAEIFSPHNPPMPASANISRELERLKLLVPELAPTIDTTSTPHAAYADSRNLQEYALAYVEHYRGDVLQLEHEWGILHAALMEAWRDAQYAVVVRLVAGLVHSISRMSKLEEAKRILHMGIVASRYTREKPRMAYFLNRLGNLLFSHGQYAQGRRVWYTSLQVAGYNGRPQGLPLLEPLSSFAQIADILGNYTASQQFVETLPPASQDDDPITLAVATFIRAFHARHVAEMDRAYDDLRYCLRLLASQPVDNSLASYRQLFTIVVQTELARVQGDYDRSQAYTETALALAQLFADRYTCTVLLIDQLQFAQQLGQQAYAPSMPTESIEQEKFIALIEPLSERELEVLQLVSTGLSNRKIAGRLVITPGTVKKHLEHIYSKLNVHNRTAAIARARMLKIFC